MPQPPNMAKAILQEIGWNDEGTVNRQGRQLKVQFNPETLKVTFSNQIKSGGQAGGSAIQFSGRGTTKLSFDLWFDVTDPNFENLDDKYKDNKKKAFTDVRRITKQVSDFMKVTKKGTKPNIRYVPPGVRFLWGTFLFEGVMDSINETIEFFSEEGKPLRASVAVSLTKQEVDVKFWEQGERGGSGGTPGTEPMEAARQNEPIQHTAARRGCVAQWQADALSNNIENPRHILPGTPLKLAIVLNTRRIPSGRNHR